MAGSAWVVLTIGFWYYINRKMGGATGGRGSSIFGFGQANAKRYDKDSKIKTTFADVAGLDEAKTEIMEFVSFLKNPAKYQSLGAKIPKVYIFSRRVP